MHSSSKNPIYPWHFEKSITESCQEVPSSCFTHTDYTGKVNFRQVWLFQGTLRVRSWAAIPPWCRVSEVSHDERWHPQVRGGAGREGQDYSIHHRSCQLYVSHWHTFMEIQPREWRAAASVCTHLQASLSTENHLLNSSLDLDLTHRLNNDVF